MTNRYLVRFSAQFSGIDLAQRSVVNRAKFAVLILAVFVFSSTFAAAPAHAWGKRGHEIVAAVATRLLEEKMNKPLLRAYEFDMGYYTNVPDIIWRSTSKSLGNVETPQHYIDWNDALKSVFGTPQNLPVSFAEYKKKMGAHFNTMLGESPWRIHDLGELCKTRAKSLDTEKQGPLIECLGLVSHYTGDLSMPLHTTDNYDGQFSGQKGVHVYFESELVNALDPEIKITVMNQALREYDGSPFGGQAKNLSNDQLVRNMITDSQTKIKELLDLDKKTDRKNIAVAKEKFKALITQRLVIGAIFTARFLGNLVQDVKFLDEGKLHFFDGSPAYIEPDKETH